MKIRRFVETYYLDISLQILLAVAFFWFSQNCEVAGYVVEYTSEMGELQSSGPQEVCVTDYKSAIGFILFALIFNLLFRNRGFLMQGFKDQ